MIVNNNEEKNGLNLLYMKWLRANDCDIHIITAVTVRQTPAHGQLCTVCR